MTKVDEYGEDKLAARRQQLENWRNQLRDWPEPDWVTTEGGQATWKACNYKRWPLHRIPKYDRTGIEVNL